MQIGNNNQQANNGQNRQQKFSPYNPQSNTDDVPYGTPFMTGREMFNAQKAMYRQNLGLSPYTRPEYNALGSNGELNPNLRSFNPNNEQRTSQLNQNNVWRQEANSVAPTNVAQRQLDANTQSFADQRNMSERSARSNMAGQLDQIAMRGGVGNGNMERMTNNLYDQQSRNNQDLRMKEELGRLGILTDDANYKRELTRNVYDNDMNREMADAKLRDVDIQRGMQEHRNIYDHSMRGYEAEMEKFASDKASNAQVTSAREANSGWCFVTTACCDLLGLPDDNNILETFRKWRDEDLGGKAGVQAYYINAPKILKAMEERNDKEYLYTVISKYLVPIFALLKANLKEQAYDKYEEMTLHLEERYMEVA